MPAGLQTSIWSNRLRSIYLLILFPVFLFGVFLAIFSIAALQQGNIYQDAWMLGLQNTLNIFMILGPVILVWCLISFIFYRQIVFGFSGARPITRKENPKIYNIVENLCISRGLPTPNIGIIDDESMNAFALGWNPQKAWIVFSAGLIDRLNDREIEAVAAHELTHIINKDSLVMIIVVVFIGAIATIGEITLRIALHSKGGNDKEKGNITGVLLLVGAVLMILGYLVFPFVQLALSRKREYLADAGSVLLTKDREALKSALLKISGDPVIESIKKRTVAMMCIENPFSENSWFSELFSTHPSITNRIKALDTY